MSTSPTLNEAKVVVDSPSTPSRHPHQLKLHAQHHYAWFNPHYVQFKDANGNDIEWQSRRQRKRRYAPVQCAFEHAGQSVEPYMRLPTVELKPNLHGDVSFWIAVAFTAGSVIWVINGALGWLPHIYESMDTDAISETASGIGFIGGVLFEIGAYLMVVEALDRGREHEFGTALGNFLSPSFRERIEYDFSSKRKRRIMSGSKTTGDPQRHEYPNGSKGWIWWGRPQWHDMGYFAAFVMFVSATVFGFATITGLPGVIPGMGEGRHVAIADIFFWAPQLIGSVGFIVSSVVLTLEVQHRWWKPRPLDIGWHVGFWNLIGSVGFLLCGVLGFSQAHAMKYESTLSTFWGSCAFLIGSVCQLWEVSLREPPKDKDEEGGGE